jgi:arylsulfatase A-like enzyme
MNPRKRHFPGVRLWLEHFGRILLLIPLLFVLETNAADAPSAASPNFVFILADDLGWRDVGFNGSEIKTPNIDRMAGLGVRLNQFYVLPICSPTRAALLTGRYPIRTGFQTGVVRPWSPYGLPPEERTLGHALKEAGYTTAIVGKWHLGHARPEFLPTRLGFDRQYGHHLGVIDYYKHARIDVPDWHRNDKPLKEEGYSTTLIGKEAARVIEKHDFAKPLFLFVPFNAPHTPLQAPDEYIAKYSTIEDESRRIFAAMVTCMDDEIGRILKALETRGVAANTLVMFTSDNGGAVRNGASNHPLRGGKTDLYEGGVRVPACAMWSGSIQPGTVVNEPVHIVDVFPTLVLLAGGSIDQPLPLDGRDIRATITKNAKSPRQEILLNVEPNRGAIRRGDWKLIVAGPLPQPVESPKGKLELFNLVNDPREQRNLAKDEPEKLRELLARLNHYAEAAAPPLNRLNAGLEEKFRTSRGEEADSAEDGPAP